MAGAGARLVAALVALRQLDHPVQDEHPTVGLGLEDLDVLVLGVLVVQRVRDLAAARGERDGCQLKGRHAGEVARATRCRRAGAGEGASLTSSDSA